MLCGSRGLELRHHFLLSSVPCLLLGSGPWWWLTLLGIEYTIFLEVLEKLKIIYNENVSWNELVQYLDCWLVSLWPFGLGKNSELFVQFNTNWLYMHDKLYQILQGILTLNDIVFYYRSPDSVLDIDTRLWAGCLRTFGLTVALGRRFISSPSCPHQLWDPLNFIFNRCWGLFPRERSVWGVKLSTSVYCQG